MKRTRIILTLSLLLNAVLLGVLAYSETDHRIQRFLWESEASGWAKYAGAMQAVADYGNGVRRFYRPTLAKDAKRERVVHGATRSRCRSLDVDLLREHG